MMAEYSGTQGFDAQQKPPGDGCITGRRVRDCDG
jgi:hypothetical protein